MKFSFTVSSTFLLGLGVSLTQVGVVHGQPPGFVERLEEVWDRLMDAGVLEGVPVDFVGNDVSMLEFSNIAKAVEHFEPLEALLIGEEEGVSGVSGRFQPPSTNDGGLGVATETEAGNDLISDLGGLFTQVDQKTVSGAGGITRRDLRMKEDKEEEAVAMNSLAAQGVTAEEVIETARLPRIPDPSNFLPDCSPFSVERFEEGTCEGDNKSKKGKSGRFGKGKSSKGKSGFDNLLGGGITRCKTSKSGKGKTSKSGKGKSSNTGENEDGGEDGEGGLFGAGAGTNRYAWGADCSTQGGGTVCVMAHSGGTPAALSGEPAQPVITIRSGTGNPDYEDQEVIARVQLEEDEFGLRSAQVWKINRDECGNIESVELIFGDISLGGGASLGLYTIELKGGSKKSKSGKGKSGKGKSGNGGSGCATPSTKKAGKSGKGSSKSSSKDGIKCDTDVKVEKTELLGPMSQPLPGNSIRALRLLPGSSCGGESPADDVVVFAPWDDSFGLFSMTPVTTTVFVYDPDRPSVPPVAVELDVPQSQTTRPQIWDFEIDTEFDRVYYNVARSTPDISDLRVSPIEIVPELYVGALTDLCDAADSLGSMTETVTTMVTEFTAVSTVNIGSLGSVQPIPGADQVLYCSMSGFVYQGLLSGFLTPGGRRELGQNDGGRELQVFDFLKGLELGAPQVCYVCDPTVPSCTGPTVPPSQNPLSAYIWDLTVCHGKVFAGTLDLTGLLAALIKGLILDFLADLDLPFICNLDFTGPILNLLIELFVYFILSLILRQPILKSDGGFNLLYADIDDLTNGTSDPWKVITTDGFNRVLDEDDQQIIFPPELFYEEGFLGYLRNRSVEDGVRNMVCSDDRYLHVGTAVYGSEPSNTYILDLASDRGSDSCPAPR